MMISCNVCGLDYDADDRDSCPRCDPDVSPRFHTTVRDDITKHVHLTIEHLGDEAFEEFQMALKTLIQEDFDGEVVVRD